MPVEERSALTHTRPAQPCLVRRFTRCPRADAARCAKCGLLEQARMAAALARTYCRQARL